MSFPRTHTTKGAKVPAEQSAKTPSPRTGLLALLRALLPVNRVAKRCSTPSSRPASFAVLVLAAIALLLPAAAQAKEVHVLSTTFGAATSTPANPYPLRRPTDVAIDHSNSPSAGDVYVTDTGNARVEEFSSSRHLHPRLWRLHRPHLHRRRQLRRHFQGRCLRRRFRRQHRLQVRSRRHPPHRLGRQRPARRQRHPSLRRSRRPCRRLRRHPLRR